MLSKEGVAGFQRLGGRTDDEGEGEGGGRMNCKFREGLQESCRGECGGEVAGVDLVAVEVLEKRGVEAGKGEDGGECCTKAVRVTNCYKAASNTK